MRHLVAIKVPLMARLCMFACATLAFAAMSIGSASAQTISTLAGNGSRGFSGDGGPATAAALNRAFGVAIDAAGNRYIADTFNYRIRKVTPSGVISTVAGNGTPGFSGDGGPATSAQISQVHQVAVDAAGNLYLPDGARIRKISKDGTITTIVGREFCGFSGDGGPAINARLCGAWDIAFDATGNMYFTDNNNFRVRKVDTAGIITTIAGNGMPGFSGDGGPARLAQFQVLFGISATSDGVVYVADSGNSRIRRIGTDGVISTVVGTGASMSTGDGGPATAAAISVPHDVAVAPSGGFYVADTFSHRIRYVSPTGIISTVAGSTFGFSGDGGPATSARLSVPTGVAIGNGQLLIADSDNDRIRLVSLFSSCADEGYTGIKLTLCTQICEIPQSPARLSALIKTYVTAYREDPPCAR